MRIIGMVAQRVTVEDGADFRTAERQSEVAARTGVNGVHGESAGFVGGAGECFEIQCGHRRFLGLRKERAD
jgi:hypothetical protein